MEAHPVNGRIRARVKRTWGAVDTESMAQNPLYGLDRTAERIRLVHEAALRAAARIRLDADRIRTLAGADSPNGSVEPGDTGHPGLGRAAAMADLADVVADRTEAISRDYAELSRMLDGSIR